MYKFFLLDAEVKKHHAKAMQRAGALGAFHPDTALVALPATSDMVSGTDCFRTCAPKWLIYFVLLNQTEDLLLSEDGAEIMADTVDLVRLLYSRRCNLRVLFLVLSA